MISQKTVLVTGVFDVLHPKHIEFLESAKKLGDILVVGLESDKRVKQMKGEDRPYYSEDQRVHNLQDLNIADDVFLLPDNFNMPEVREDFIKKMRPAFLAVSSHSPHLEGKRQLIEKYGGRLVVVTEFDPNFSSTKMIAELKNKKGKL